MMPEEHEVAMLRARLAEVERERDAALKHAASTVESLGRDLAASAVLLRVAVEERDAARAEVADLKQTIDVDLEALRVQFDRVARERDKLKAIREINNSTNFPLER